MSFGIARHNTVRSGSSPLVTNFRAVANRLGLPQTQTTAFEYVLAQTVHVLMKSVHGPLKVWFPNFIVEGGVAVNNGCQETATGGTATMAAKVTYTDAITGSSVTVDLIDDATGSTTLSAASGQYFKAACNIRARASTTITVKCAADYSSCSFMPSTYWHADIANGDMIEVGSSPFSVSSTPSPNLEILKYWFGPSLIASQHNGIVAGIVGDSADEGAIDFPSGNGDVGMFGRLFATAGIPYVNCSGQGERAQTVAAMGNFARRAELLQFATFVAIGFGANDILSQGRTAAQAEADNQTVIAALGKPFVRKTLFPSTKNGITTPVSASPETERLSFNTALRAGADPLVDSAAVLENSGAWRGWALPFGDYLHPTNVANIHAATHAAITGTDIRVHGVAARAVGSNFTDTNLSPSATDLSSGGWTLGDATLDNAGTATQALREAATTAAHQVYGLHIYSAPAAPGQRFRFLADLKQGVGRDWAVLSMLDAAFDELAFAYFNLTNGDLGSYGVVPAPVKFTNIYPLPRMALVGGGYSCGYEITVQSNVTGLFFILGLASADGTSSYAGNTSNYMFATNVRYFPVPNFR